MKPTPTDKSQTENSESKCLPEGWGWTTMGEISTTIGGGTPKTNNPAYYEGGTIPWITPADLSGYQSKHIGHGERFITEAGLKNSSARMMPEGTVLFTSRAPIGYVAIASNPVCTNQGFKSFVLKEDILPDYVYWYLKGNKDIAESLASGTTFLELSGAKAKQIPFPLAPLPVQHLIVAEIEKQFSRLDEAVAGLKRVKANLKRYKASVLKAAVEGRLTGEWRKQNICKGGSRTAPTECESGADLLKRILVERRKKWGEDYVKKYVGAHGYAPKDESWKKKYKEPAAPDTANLPELPEGWVWASLDQLSDKITDGEHLSPKMQEHGIPMLSAKDVRDNGVVFDDAKYVRPEDAERFRARCNPERNDVLIVSRGATIGRACTIETDKDFCLMGSVILLKLQNVANSSYLLKALKSLNCQKRMLAVSGSTAQQAIYIRDIRSVAIPLPPMIEQHTIVADVDCRLSVAEEIEAVIETNLKRAERMRQAILKKAFEGRLV